MRTSTEWLRHFENNARQLLDIPWERGEALTAEEITAVGPSIAEFQRGESGEGRHLIKYARAYAERTGDHDYAPAIVLFIREEQRHARDLRRVLDLYGIPLARASFADAVFRRLRNVLGTIEISVAVLITAELMAQVCLDRASSRPMPWRIWLSPILGGGVAVFRARVRDRCERQATRARRFSICALERATANAQGESRSLASLGMTISPRSRSSGGNADGERRFTRVEAASNDGHDR